MLAGSTARLTFHPRCQALGVITLLLPGVTPDQSILTSTCLIFFLSLGVTTSSQLLIVQKVHWSQGQARRSPQPCGLLTGGQVGETLLTCWPAAVQVSELYPPSPFSLE